MQSTFNPYRYAYVAVQTNNEMNLLIMSYPEMIRGFIHRFFYGPYNETKWFWLPPWTLKFMSIKNDK